MIDLDNISFTYGTTQTSDAQLQEINLSIKRGEFILLTGESGCGKTTLTRVLNGLCPQFYPGKLIGKYTLDKRDATKISIDELGTIVGSVFQDPRSQFYATNTTDEIVLGMENNAVSREQMQEQLTNVSSLVGLDNLLDRSIFPLSSGEKQRVAIASVCTMSPQILVLDEPSANLDSDAISRLGTLLYRLKESGTTIILSEHRLHFVRDCFDRMVCMKDGRISEIFSRKDALTLTDRQMKERGLRPFTEPRFLPNRRIEYDNKSLLCARELGIAFEGKRVLNKVSFSTDRGHVLAIVGGNGAGKSTLCRVITGLYKQNIGQVIIDGLAQKKKNRLRKTFFVQQDADYQLYAATVEDEFRIGKRHRNISVTEMEKSLSSVGLENMLHRHPLSLSGGQKQRLLLAISAVSGKRKSLCWTSQHLDLMELICN